MNSVVYENSLFLIAYKDHNVATVPLKTQSSEGTLLDFVCSHCADILKVNGRNFWEFGALHRLDTATAGLVLFAKTQEFYDYIQQIQNLGKFEKTYTAVCDESRPIEVKSISSYFRSFGPGAKLVKAESDVKKADSERLYTTFIKREKEGVYQCKLTRGFRHQIRVHLASNGCPIVGDKLYNPHGSELDMQLTCTALSFPMQDGSVFSYSLQ